ncbi:hypothetical protein CVS40_9426 [Lucilia cuprina]|nr:hypothetical protein CVS40_9426 [Lucilia cuprina]
MISIKIAITAMWSLVQDFCDLKKYTSIKNYPVCSYAMFNIKNQMILHFKMLPTCLEDNKMKIHHIFILITMSLNLAANNAKPPSYVRMHEFCEYNIVTRHLVTCSSSLSSTHKTFCLTTAAAAATTYDISIANGKDTTTWLLSVYKAAYAGFLNPIGISYRLCSGTPVFNGCMSSRRSIFMIMEMELMLQLVKYQESLHILENSTVLVGLSGSGKFFGAVAITT